MKPVSRLYCPDRTRGSTMGFTQSLLEDHEFIADCCRFAEGITSEAAVRKKYHFSEEAWERLGVDDKLIEAVELEKTRRIRSGEAKREKAQQHIVKGPDILNDIMCDTKASPKHKVDAIKTLDALAANGSGAAPEQDRVVIRIDLTAGGGEVVEFDKTIRPQPSDVNIIDDATHTPQELPPP